MADLSAGTVLLERFTLGGVLGRGGMATVYLAQDRLRGERIALKVLHPHLAQDPSPRERLRREVRAAALVQHEGALLAREIHELEGTLALSLPLHTGSTLTQRVAAGGPLPEPALRALGSRLARVLASAHRAGVLHRDVTPDNVMIDGQDQGVLTDFGLARLAEQLQTLMRRRGRVQGTETAGPSVQLIAEVPLSEMFGYAGDLRGVTRGAGTFSMASSRDAARA